MKYQFPVIEHIDQVRAAIADHPEFVVAERDYGTIINYLVSTPDTFDMVGPDDINGAIRRECRGIIFDRSGRIMSRPFGKFFNVGERDETQPHSIDFGLPHKILAKLDGSMVRPLRLESSIRWGTKMGITDVALNAEKFVARNTKYRDFAQWATSNDLTPIFEWCSRLNKIVLDYPNDSLTLLAVRHNITGEYLSIS